ncbi:MAG: flagellar basal body L-ring protein FlgH [Armatimonadetes bacterium]|nr:flagellar basal body L-ring protein FlgH [Armatimonadota bacterium]
MRQLTTAIGSTRNGAARLCLAAAFATLASAAVGQTHNPGSLWNDSARSPFADRTARRPGDVLTVLIAEASSASTSAQTQTQKRDSTKVDAGIGPILQALIPSLSTGSDFKSQGQGTTTRSGRLSARLTVIVKQVLPNGNLVVEGTRFVQVNNDIQKLTLTGIVRPDDIRSDNTIFSEFIAEATIRYDGKGPVGDRQRKGLISRLLDWLF